MGLPTIRNTPGVVGFARRAEYRLRLGIRWLLCRADVQWFELAATTIAVGWGMCILAHGQQQGLAANLIAVVGGHRMEIAAVAICCAIPSTLATVFWVIGRHRWSGAVYHSRRLGMFALAWFYGTIATLFALTVGPINTGTVVYGVLGVTAFGAYIRLRIKRGSATLYE